MNKYILSKKEKEGAIELFKELDGDLNEAAKRLFEDPNEKGSTIRGRALRKFWVEKGFEYRTKVKKKSSKYFLQENEKDFVHRHYCAEMTKREIAQLLWTEETNNRGFYESARFIALSDFINREFPNVINLRDEIAGDRYAPPKIMTTVIKKVNKVVFKEFDIEKISVADRKCLERLLTYLCAPRFVQVINAYPTKQNRELLESEYIRSTWDKPDLTADELNLYINVCMDYINLKEIEQQKQKLNLMFDDTEGQHDLTMRLTEMLKTKSEEYNLINLFDNCGHNLRRGITISRYLISQISYIWKFFINEIRQRDKSRTLIKTPIVGFLGPQQLRNLSFCHFSTIVSVHKILFVLL